ncbi:MAG: hypothetical protein LBL51_00385, partial [Synergistaceae bacterium]|nr:hypothetical protein [Synergistaceae bacterium]
RHVVNGAEILCVLDHVEIRERGGASARAPGVFLSGLKLFLRKKEYGAGVKVPKRGAVWTVDGAEYRVKSVLDAEGVYEIILEANTS